MRFWFVVALAIVTGSVFFCLYAEPVPGAASAVGDLRQMQRYTVRQVWPSINTTCTSWNLKVNALRRRVGARLNVERHELDVIKKRLRFS
jgi:hypothetical protein